MSRCAANSPECYCRANNPALCSCPRPREDAEVTALRAEVEALRGERDRALSAARMLRECFRHCLEEDTDADVDGVMQETRWLDAADEKETT